MTTLTPKFQVGRVHITRTLADNIDSCETMAYFMACLDMHQSGQWGLVSKNEAAANISALSSGTRIMSAYPLPDAPDNFWIITEPDRKDTTMLLPSDY